MWPEALPPFIIIAACITVTGISLRLLDRWENNGKPRRYKVDQWDKTMMARDLRITRVFRKQQSL
jgi:hypothetical protein